MGNSADATLAWGVYLNTGDYGELHDSLFDEEDDSVFEDYALESRLNNQFPLVSIGQCGLDGDWGSFLVLERRKVWAYDYGHREVTPEAWIPPSEEEIRQINGYLDGLGYTGPREVKLYVFASYG